MATALLGNKLSSEEQQCFSQGDSCCTWVAGCMNFHTIFISCTFPWVWSFSIWNQWDVSSGDLTCQIWWDQGVGSWLTWKLFRSGKRSCHVSLHLYSPPARYFHPGRWEFSLRWMSYGFSDCKVHFLLRGAGLYTLPCFNPERISASPNPRHQPHFLLTDTSILQLSSTGLLHHQTAGYHHLVLQLKPAMVFILQSTAFGHGDPCVWFGFFVGGWIFFVLNNSTYSWRSS